MKLIGNRQTLSASYRSSLLKLFGALALTLAALSAQVAVAGAAPVLELDLDETTGLTATDSSAEGNDGLLNGATWTTGGRYGGGALFDGVNDWITIADDDSLDLEDGTVEAWVKPSSLADWATVAIKEDSGGMSYGMYASDGGGTNWNACLGEECIYSPPLDEDVWSHLALVFDGDELRLYVNGELIVSQEQFSSPTASSEPLRIGGNNIWGEYFDGIIEDHRRSTNPRHSAHHERDPRRPRHLNRPPPRRSRSNNLH